MVYMVMNHRKAVDDAYIQYSYTVSDSPQKPVTPYWFDEVNCHTDPIYNVPGTRPKGSSDVRSSRLPDAGRRPDRRRRRSRSRRRSQADPEPARLQQPPGRAVNPTWGFASHPFYNVRPILHEPGPINMTAFSSTTGVPVKAGTRLRMNAIYDNSRPHVQ